MYDEFMRGFYQFTLCILALVSFSYLARTMLGPTFFDRILGANNISTIVTVMICILAVEQGEQYLVDVALIYSMLGFVTVVIVCKAYLRSHNMELYSRFRNLPAPVKAERMATHLTTVATVVSHKKEDASVEPSQEEASQDTIQKQSEEASKENIQESPETALEETTLEDTCETVSTEAPLERQASQLEGSNEERVQENEDKEQGGKKQQTTQTQEKKPSSQGQSQKKNYPNQKQGKKKKKGGKKS